MDLLKHFNKAQTCNPTLGSEPVLVPLTDLWAKQGYPTSLKSTFCGKNIGLMGLSTLIGDYQERSLTLWFLKFLFINIFYDFFATSEKTSMFIRLTWLDH